MKSLFSFLFLIIFLTKFSYGVRDYRCVLPLNPRGLLTCMAYMEKYGYDAKTGKCVKFIYGGCGGNENSFYSKHLCEQACIM